MKKLFWMIAVLPFLLSACCDENDTWLVRAILPDPEIHCDSAAATPYQRRFELSNTEALPVENLADGQRAFLATKTGYVYRDMENGTLVQRVESPIAAKALTSTNIPYRNGELALVTSATGLAVVNIKSGALVWEQGITECDLQGNPTGVDNTFIVKRRLADPDGTGYDALFVGNLNVPGRLDPLCTPAYNRTLRNWCGFGRIAGYQALRAENGHTLVLMCVYEPLDAMKIQSFLALYDVTDGRWMYARKMLGDSQSSVPGFAITGYNTARFAYLGHLVVWDIAAGQEQFSISIPSMDGYCTAGATSVWANEKVSVVGTFCGQLELYDNPAGTLLKRLQTEPSGLHIDAALDRLFAIDQDHVHIYELSTGRLLETIVPPCENDFPARFTSVVCWKDAAGQIELTISGSNGAAYRYRIQ